MTPPTKQNPSIDEKENHKALATRETLTVDAERPETPNTSSMMAVIAKAASDPNIDVDKMERLLSMVERMKATEAEGKFNTAMAEAQAEMPRVFRDAQNPSTNSRYTRLESLNDAVVPVTTKYGFAMSFGTADCPTPGNYRVTCTVSHKGGHSRSYQLDLPSDNLGPKGLPNKTLVHGAGSSMSYGRRYLTLMIFNISLTNDDDDANRAGRKQERGPAVATEKTRLWFMGQIADIAEQACNFASEHGWLAPNEKIEQWPLEHVPVSKQELAALRAEINEWVSA